MENTAFHDPYDTAGLETKMALAQQGDKHAYHILLKEISQLLRGILHKKISHQDAVEDILQEILISVHRARHTYDPSRPFMPWLFSIVQYRVNDYLRRMYRQKDNVYIDFSEAERYLETPTFTHQDDIQALKEALNKLPARQRKIVTLMKVDGYTAKEVAKHLDMNESAVKVSAHRAYKKLQQDFA
ncbi:MAG: sigma-70 family RNA polymerase sigma factor [Rickettsiales bacterium]|nr:sigma-70 family RNA polymerase sigma factor [Rickettsiales bacterium]